MYANLTKSNYVMYGLKGKGNNIPTCLLVGNEFHSSRTFRSPEALEIYCARCTVIALNFNENTYTVIMYAGTAIYITNYISKLSLESFKDLKGVKSLTIIK